MSSFGETVDAFDVGAVRVTVRYGCVRRDQYELRSAAALPPVLADRLAAASGREASVRGSEKLYVVDVPGVHQITVAPAAGRIVIMPRLERSRPEQREAALRVAAIVADVT